MIAIFPEIMTATESGDVEKLAILVRKYFAGKDRFRPAPDLYALAESAGLTIERVPLEVQGILAAKDERGTVTVAAFVNKSLPADEERFLLAHMLGHYFLEILPMVARGEWNASGFRETFCPLKRFSQNISYDQNRSVELAKELLADRFAGALLMPVAMVIKAAEKIQDQGRLSAFFLVTRSCLQRRLVDCGLMGSMPVSFMDAEQRLIAEHKISIDHEPDPVEINVPMDRSLVKSAATASYKTSPGAHLAQVVASERQTKVDNKGAPLESRTDSGGGKSLKGMDRIREIARKLDRG